jgi:transcriptional regulator with XRE-family HTH domain
LLVEKQIPFLKEAIENIKKFRELKNITREESADQLEMSLSGYSKLERGEVVLTITKMYRIAELLEVSVSQILNFDASQIFNVRDHGVANVDIKSQTNNLPRRIQRQLHQATGSRSRASEKKGKRIKCPEKW